MSSKDFVASYKFLKIYMSPKRPCSVCSTSVPATEILFNGQCLLVELKGPVLSRHQVPERQMLFMFCINKSTQLLSEVLLLI